MLRYYHQRAFNINEMQYKYLSEEGTHGITKNLKKIAKYFGYVD